MKIDKFIGIGIHNYIDIDINFNNDLSVLVGSNGAGKTSSLLLLQGLLCPNIKDLFTIPFKSIKVEFTNKGHDYSLSAVKKDNELILKSSTSEESIIIDSILYDELEYMELKRKDAGDINEVIFNKFGNHPIFEFIRELPSPLFLNLERKNQNNLDSSDMSLERRRYMAMSRERNRLSKYRRQFQGSLGSSLLDTEFLVQENYRRLKSFEDNYMSRLKDEILFSSFEYIPFNPEKLSNIKEKRALLSKKGEIENALRRIGYSDNQKFYKKFNDFFSKVEDLLKIENNEDKGMNIELLTNQYQLEKLSKIAEIIDEYNSKINERFKVFNSFIDIVNSYFVDSQKTVSVDKVGHLFINRPNNEKVPIDALSSGERQILIIFANLLFNKTNSGGIFIIDEPELSLHIRWQEKFIDSLTNLKTSNQFILATHSPDIVGDYKSKCVSI